MITDIKGKAIEVGDHVITYVADGYGLYHAEVVRLTPKRAHLKLVDGPKPRKSLLRWPLCRHVEGNKHYTPLLQDPKKIYVVKSMTDQLAADSQLESVREAAWSLGYDAGYETGLDTGYERGRAEK